MIYPTKIEAEALQGIIDSDFRDGNDPVDCWVWSWSANPFSNSRTFSGALTNLIKKGWAQADGNKGDEACVCITAEGLKALEGYNHLESKKTAAA